MLNPEPTPMSILTTTNYLSIVNGALITDILVIVLLIQGSINSKVLIDWYKTYNLRSFSPGLLSVCVRRQFKFLSSKVCHTCGVHSNRTRPPL